MTTLQIDLPEGLADEAAKAGLLSPAALEQLLRDAMRQRALNQFQNAMARVSNMSDEEMTPEEIQQEIRSARAERRARESGAAGS